LGEESAKKAGLSRRADYPRARERTCAHEAASCAHAVRDRSPALDALKIATFASACAGPALLKASSPVNERGQRKDRRHHGSLRRRGIACSNPGSAQDVAKTPILKNTAQTTLYEGQRLNWWASDGDIGQVTLAADLPPGGTVKAMGKAGNAYTCTSGCVAQPDLKIRTAKMLSSSQALVEVQNADPYVGASASSVLFEIRSCQTNAVLMTARSEAVAIAKGEHKQLTFAVPIKPFGKTYLRAVADHNSVSESNELNNGWNGQNGASAATAPGRDPASSRSAGRTPRALGSATREAPPSTGTRTTWATSWRSRTVRRVCRARPAGRRSSARSAPVRRRHRVREARVGAARLSPAVTG
jgi:hypothetical protein